jgi:hypothetical protein
MGGETYLLVEYDVPASHPAAAPRDEPGPAPLPPAVPMPLPVAPVVLAAPPPPPPPVIVAMPIASAPATTAPVQPAVAPVPEALRQGGRARVQGTDGEGLRIRAAPSLSASLRTVLGEDTHVEVLEGPVAADGYQWYRVRYAGASEGGWAVSQFLQAPR